MKKTILKTAFLVALIVGTVLIIRENSRKTYQRDEGKIFGTFYHITYQSGENLHDEILAELQRVDRSLSMFNDSSTISRVNRNEAVDLSADSLFIEVYAMARRIAEDTDGAFDITVAPLVNAWGFGFKNEQMPTDAAVDSLRAFVGYKKVSLVDNSSKTSPHSGEQRGAFVQKSDPRTMLDCSAIAKGFGCDLIGRLFRQKGIENYMIEIGG
ncbi:MAG: FAD:protein FMN transferase, partial [Prevotella sp.]|nr:FAD:protein FMN transferase [Prevotella sp.]